MNKKKAEKLFNFSEFPNADDWWDRWLGWHIAYVDVFVSYDKNKVLIKQNKLEQLFKVFCQPHNTFSLGTFCFEFYTPSRLAGSSEWSFWWTVCVELLCWPFPSTSSPFSFVPAEKQFKNSEHDH